MYKYAFAKTTHTYDDDDDDDDDDDVYMCIYLPLCHTLCASYMPIVFTTSKIFFAIVL